LKAEGASVNILTLIAERWCCEWSVLGRSVRTTGVKRLPVDTSHKRHMTMLSATGNEEEMRRGVPGRLGRVKLLMMEYMNKLNSIQQEQVRSIARAILLLVRATRSHDQLEDILDLTNQLAKLVDNNESQLHADLGQNLVEFVLLTMDDVKAGTEQSVDTKMYLKNVELLLNS
jgi:hypothetical protein